MKEFEFLDELGIKYNGLKQITLEAFGIQYDLEELLNELGLTRLEYEALSLVQIEDWRERFKEMLLLEGLKDHLLLNYLDILIYVKSNIDVEL